jgi:hypothetical protein
VGELPDGALVRTVRKLLEAIAAYRSRIASSIVRRGGEKTSTWTQPVSPVAAA